MTSLLSLDRSPIFQALKAQLTGINASAAIPVAVPVGSDITANIQAAIAANPGRVLALPVGNWTISSPIIFTVNGSGLVGQGESQTSLRCTGPSSAGQIRFQPSNPATGAQVANCLLSGLTITTAALDTTGVGVCLTQAVNMTMTDVVISSFGIALDMLGVSNVFLERVRTYYYLGTNTVAGTRYLRVRAGYSGTTVDAQCSYGVFVSNCSFTATGTGVAQVEVGVELLAVDGFYMNGNNYVGEALDLCHLKVQNNNCYLGNLTFSGVLWDGNNGQSQSGLKIVYDPVVPGRPITKITIDDCDFASFQQYGIQIGTGQTSAITITGNTFGSVAGVALDMVGVSSAVISSNAFIANGTYGNANTGSIRYVSNCSIVSIVGNTFQDAAYNSLDIISTSAPVHLQQLGNATNRATPVPVVNT